MIFELACRRSKASLANLLEWAKNVEFLRVNCQLIVPRQKHSVV